MSNLTPTLVVCEQSDRWRLAWQTWQSRLDRTAGKVQTSVAQTTGQDGSRVVVRSVRHVDELGAAIERWQPAGVLLEIAATNQVAACRAIAQLATRWPRGLLFAVGSRSARAAEASARWAGAAGCAWSARELPPLVQWFEQICQKLEAPPGNWEESIRASFPWRVES
jgi:hypothetical protein